MTSQGHVTTASTNKECIESGIFYLSASQKVLRIFETSHIKLRDPKQYNVKI